MTLEDKSAIVEHKIFLKTKDCPELVKIADQHAVTAYTSNNKTRHQQLQRMTSLKLTQTMKMPSFSATFRDTRLPGTNSTYAP